MRFGLNEQLSFFTTFQKTKTRNLSTIYNTKTGNLFTIFKKTKTRNVLTIFEKTKTKNLFTIFRKAKTRNHIMKRKLNRVASDQKSNERDMNCVVLLPRKK